MCGMFDTPGEVISDFLTVVQYPEGLRQLVNLPPGSAEAELGGLLPLVHVYHYLEAMSLWGILGEDIQAKSAGLRQRIRDGEETLRTG